jgi:hypothetical protein
MRGVLRDEGANQPRAVPHAPEGSLGPTRSPTARVTRTEGCPGGSATADDSLVPVRRQAGSLVAVGLANGGLAAWNHRATEPPVVWARVWGADGSLNPNRRGSPRPFAAGLSTG